MQRSTLYIGQKTSNTFLYRCLVKLVDCFTTQTLEQLQLLCSGSAVYCVGYSKTNQHKLTTVFSLKKSTILSVKQLIFYAYVQLFREQWKQQDIVNNGGKTDRYPRPS